RFQRNFSGSKSINYRNQEFSQLCAVSVRPFVGAMSEIEGDYTHLPAPLPLRKINIAALHIGPRQLYTHLVAYVQPLRALRQQAFHVRLQHADERSLRSHACDHGIEHLSYAMAHCY